VRHDDPDLSISWPFAVTALSARDAAADSWASLRKSLMP
jgi:dTDP-4-dehydrorhamnose 3,5-epimerase